MSSSTLAFKLLNSWASGSHPLRIAFTGPSVQVKMRDVVIREVRPTSLVVGGDDGDPKWNFVEAEFALIDTRSVLVRASGEECAFHG